MDRGGVLRPSAGARRHVWRQAAVVALLVALAVVVFVAEAQAYVSGDLIYAKRIGTSTSPAASYTVAAGPDGAIAVAGEKWSTTLGDWAPMVAKYNSAGERVWTRTFTDLGKGDVHAVAFDATGSVYVAVNVDNGDGTGYDIALVRYGSAGTFKWAQAYDGPASGVDIAQALLVDKAGDIVVAGESQGTSGLFGVVVLKYAKDGTPRWAEPARFDPDAADPNVGDIWTYDAARDADGNIYVAGSSEYWDDDYWDEDDGEWRTSALMLRFDGTDGNRAWGQLYESVAHLNSEFGQVAVRGTVVVGVGGTWPDPQDALVVRYNTGGVQRYSREWGSGNATGEWFGDVVMDGSYNVYVTGGQWSDYLERAVTMKLKPDLTTAWKATYLPTSNEAEGWHIARNSLGNIYVAGARWTLTGLMDILTMKYSATGVRKWARVWSAGGPGDDETWGLALGTAGGAFVTGTVTNKDDYVQAVLLKYKL